MKLGDLDQTGYEKGRGQEEALRAQGVRRDPANNSGIKGKISHPYLQFVAGHKGDIEARYSTNKGRLPPDMIEEHEAGLQGVRAISWHVGQPLEQSTIVKEAKLEALKSIAKSLLGIDLLEVKIAKERELEKELTSTMR